MSLVILVEPLVSSCLVLCLEPLCRWPPVRAVSFAARTTAPSGEARCERLLLTGEFHLREGISDHPRHSRRPSGYEKLSEAIMVTMDGATAMGAAAFECLLTGSGPYVTRYSAARWLQHSLRLLLAAFGSPNRTMCVPKVAV